MRATARQQSQHPSSESSSSWYYQNPPSTRCTFLFFFSSRRRHTRFDCDWRDVCSSDLQSRLEAANHIAGRDLALVERFQIDQNAAAVQRRIGSIDSDEGRKTLDRRILQNDLHQLLLLTGQDRKSVV